MSGTNEGITPAETAGRTEEDRELAEQLVEHAQSQGLDLAGPDGVLTDLPFGVPAGVCAG